MDSWRILNWAIALVAAALGVVVATFVVGRIVKRSRGGSAYLAQGWRRVRRPLVALLLSVALRISITVAIEPSPFRDLLLHVLLVATTISAVWLALTLVLAWLEYTQRRLVGRKQDDREQRRVTTRMQLIRRLVSATGVILAAALVMMTFPGVDRIGTTILASAGLISVVVGIAAQTTLGNLFAGLQLAFTDAIRIGDIVEVDDTWATVEEITLSYVSVSIWDERHKILPSTWFTTKPFINWSRTGDTVTGLVYLDVDWHTDFEAMRAELLRLLDADPAWDRRAGSLVVTGAEGERVTVRAMMTSANSDDDWDLRCRVREQLIVWTRDQPTGLPKHRVLTMPMGAEAAQPATPAVGPVPEPSVASTGAEPDVPVADVTPERSQGNGGSDAE
ncbi:mechanosensitive ion channel family protein [Microlunatus sp. Y2014]|uniref:mechanosensitive ion channel family protein n=1 Tax=Microlunatus sp. Y2014 TaxID=3418488 RepID=UPI003DA7A1E3